jgi:putative ABC transport system permease protein
MNRNYFIVAIRSFWKHKLLSFINISGLAIGISASLIIYLIVAYDFSFENFHKDANQIYRVVSKIEFPDLTIHNSGAPVPTANALRNEVTGIESVTHFIRANETKVTISTVGKDEPQIYRKQEEIIYADPYYFDIFQYKWLSGAKNQSLLKPFQVVLTESRALKYFPGISLNEIIGNQIIYDDSIKATVTGIVKDFNPNTDFLFKEFISRETIAQTGLKNNWSWDEWGSINSNSQLFVKLRKNNTPKNIEQQLVSIRNKYREKRQKEDGRDDTRNLLQPLSDIHFNVEYDAFEHRQGHIPTLYGLLAVAAFLLILGCINFINLSTAQASTRAKEIGIRKTMGGSRGQLVTQFLSETFVLTLMAAIVSILITPWLLIVFGNFIPPAISIASINQWHVWLFLIVIVFIVTFLSGYYPALVLSKFQPVTVLKSQAGNNSSTTGKAWLRKTLTITQFMIAQFLLIATLVVSKQIHYSLSKDLGYKKEAIVFFNTRRNFYSDKPDNRRFVLLEKIKRIPEIEIISLSGSSPASTNTSTTTMTFSEGDKKVETMVEVKYADTNYFRLYGMKMVAGKNLLQSDTTKEFVINETYARMLGFSDPGKAIGHMISRNFNVPITGVIADFHTKSTHEPIKPLAYSSSSSNSYTFHLALKPMVNESVNWKNGLSKVEKAYKEIYPEEDFSYTFYDESIAQFYKTEQDITGLLKWSAALCMLISSLGLLGLVIFTTNTRTKEIGVRKILGASVSQIILLLSKDFISLVLIAFVVITPIAWLAMRNWLQNFAYRTDLSWWLFAASGTAMFIVAISTLSIRTYHAAIENPVKSLRSE